VKKKCSDGPIVADVREAREKIMADCDYDLRKLAKRLVKVEAESKARRRKARSHPRKSR